MPKAQKRSVDDYTLADWKWEFLRRTPQYRKAYKAVEWLKKRAQRKNGSPSVKGFGLVEAVHLLNLINRVQKLLSLNHPPLKDELKDDSRSYRPFETLPPPELAASEFEYSPVGIAPVNGIFTHHDFQGHYSGHPNDEEPIQLVADENQVIVVIDIRCKLEDIISNLRSELRPYLSTQRDQLAKFSDYLAVWDLRQEGTTHDEIARTLWPEEYKVKGGRDPELSEGKGPLLQRVHDHEVAVRRLIDASFPRKKRTTRAKKQKQPSC
jgi:hypothetical protein